MTSTPPISSQPLLSPSPQHPKQANQDHILNKKHKDLTKFEYVINREIISTAPQGKYIVIRVDGRRFKNFAEGERWYRPIDDRPYKLMNRVATEVMKIYDGTIMFASGQSDEMSFFLQLNTDLYQRRVDKIMTTIVSTFTVYYITLYKEYIDKDICPFDIDLHQAGPYFYSTVDPPIHPCSLEVPILIPTGDLSAPLSINSINGANGEKIYPWCQRYGQCYAQWCPHNHYNQSNANTPSLNKSPVTTNINTKKTQSRVTIKKHLPVFDGKVILLDNEQEVSDYLSWRQVDTHINNQYNTLFYLLTTPPPIPTQLNIDPMTSQLTNLPLRPDRIYTPQEAEAIINGTSSLEKTLLIQKYLNVDYFSLPASYKRNSLLLWSDYLPISLHRAQEELFEVTPQGMNDNDIKNSLQAKYNQQWQHSQQLYSTKQLTTINSFIKTIDQLVRDSSGDNFADIMTFLDKIIGWFFHTQNRNLAFPQTLLDFITSASSSPLNTTVQCNQILTLLHREFSQIVNQSQQQPSPHFTLPNPSELMQIILMKGDSEEQITEETHDQSNNNDNDESMTNPYLTRRVLVYHGDLIASLDSPTTTTTTTTTAISTTPLNPIKSQTYPIPFVDPQFWSSHQGLFPHTSIRQKQLQLKKDLKKLRKKQHVENRRIVRERLLALSKEEKQLNNPDNDSNNSAIINSSPDGADEKDAKSNSNPITSSPNKHIESNPNWAKKRRQYEQYYNQFGIDSTIQSKSAEINAKMIAEGDDSAYAIFNKAQKANHKVEFNTNKISSLTNWIEDVYRNHQTQEDNAQWLSKTSQQVVLDYLLRHWSATHQNEKK